MADLPHSTCLAHSETRTQAEEWSLVLHSAGIPNRVVLLEGSYHVLIAPDLLASGERALAAFAHDARLRAVPPPTRVEWGRTHTGWLFALGVAALHVGFAGRAELMDAGQLNSGAVLRGEWFRTLTALTLHADYAHALSNAVTGGVFATFLFRSLGPGLGTLLGVTAGAIANGLNAWLHGPGHFSIGASTSVFAMIGVLCGLQFAARWRYPVFHSRRRAWLPLAASMGLLAMLGTGGERTDVLAHLLGLLTGTPLGIGSGLLLARPPRGLTQGLLSATALAALGVAWMWATSSP